MSVLDRELSRLARRQHGVVAKRQLLAVGFSAQAIKSRLDDERLRSLHRGVYSTGHTALPVRGRWLAAVLALGPRAFLSHRDAAALWELRRCDRGAVDVTLAGSARRRQPGITMHRTRGMHVTDRARRHGIPVTSVARTLLDLAEVVSPTQLQRAYEEAERMRLLDVRSIAAVLERSNGRRGAAKLRALLDYDPSAAAETRSELERLFLDLVRTAGLPMPAVNVMVAGYEVDAYWSQARLVVELDSYSHHGHHSAFERDRTKQAELRLAGCEVLRLTHRKLTREGRWVVATILRFLGNRDRLRGRRSARARGLVDVRSE
jgi:very-short-patch-repair endonuclease